MSKFKVGDKVKRIAPDGGPKLPMGAIGVVTEVRYYEFSGKTYYSVDCGMGDATSIEGRIEYARIRNNSLARALYPEAKVIDEKWLEL